MCPHLSASDTYVPVRVARVPGELNYNYMGSLEKSGLRNLAQPLRIPYELGKAQILIPQKVEAVKAAQQRQDLGSSTLTSSVGPHHLGDLSAELLNRGYGVRFRAPGKSMHPTILDGDLITVEPVAPAAVKQGDIILYRLGRGVIAHRLIRIERRNGGVPHFILRGDAPGAPDEPVVVQQVLGKVVCVERGGRRIDPYSWRAELFRRARLCCSRLKRRVIEILLLKSP